jgi:hypothetical protein
VADRAAILVAHGVGAQIYECKPSETAATNWALREPVATLIVGGGTIGHHYVGPTWELTELVLRLTTRGGVLKGACRTAGELRAEPYSADYVFLR